MASPDRLQEFGSSIDSVTAGIRSRAFSVRDVAQFYTQRTKTHAAKFNSHLHFDESQIQSEITRVESLPNDLPLYGVPILIKDALVTKGVPTTCGSKFLKGYIPPYDATVIEKLRAAGALIFAKLNMDEFAMGGSSENSAFGAVKNPWDLQRVPGGSSGGSAAAIAADLGVAALGTDTGGSIRQPASLCGIVGLKPTYGAVSRCGLIAFASSLDHIGPMTRTVEDSARVFDVIAGHDRRDSTSEQRVYPKTLEEVRTKGRQFLRGKTLGVVDEFSVAGLQNEVAQAVEAAQQKMAALGANVKRIKLPHIHHSIATYYIIAPAEASSNLARYDGVEYGHRTAHKTDSLGEMYSRSRSEGFGPEVQRRILLGTFVLSSGYYDAYYGKAKNARNLVRKDFAAAFSEVDFIISPTSPTTAFKIGELMEDPLAMYLCDVFTIGANLTGIPGISVPCGFDSLGLPIGLQIMGPKFSEPALLAAAYCYEQATGWAQSRRPIF